MDVLAEGEEMRLSAQKKRRRVSRREENRLAWLAHYEHMQRQHLAISEDYARRRVDILRMGS